jgi:hypothetical protein
VSASFVLLVFFLGLRGPFYSGQIFETQEACEKERATFPVEIAKNNASDSSGKIVFYATVCAPIEKAPHVDAT